MEKVNVKLDILESILGVETLYSELIIILKRHHKLEKMIDYIAKNYDIDLEGEDK